MCGSDAMDRSSSLCQYKALQQLVQSLHQQYASDPKIVGQTFYVPFQDLKHLNLCPTSSPQLMTGT